MISSKLLALLFFSALSDLVYFKLSRPLLRIFVYLLLFLSFLFMQQGQFMDEYLRTTIMCSMMFFGLMFPYSRVMESEFKPNIPFLFRGLLSPVAIISTIPVDMSILILSVISFVSMFHTEVRVRYLLLYLTLASIFILKLLSISEFQLISLLIALLNVFILVLVTRSQKEEALLDELTNRSLVNSSILINCVLLIIAVVFDFVKYPKENSVYLGCFFCLLMSYISILKVKRI